MLQVPIPPDTLDLGKVYQVLLDVHGNDSEEHREKEAPIYRFSEEGITSFADKHDQYMRRRQECVDDDQRRGVLAKSIGQFARLCGITHALHQAFDVVEQNLDLESYEWNYTINLETCETAAMVMDYLIDQKFALMAPQVHIATVEEHEESDMDEISKFVKAESAKLKKTFEFAGAQKGIISASDAVQGRLFTPPKINGKGENKAEHAVPYLEKLCNMGFGVMKKGRQTEKKNVFAKRKWDELDQDQYDVLKKLKVEEHKYNLLFDKLDDV